MFTGIVETVGKLLARQDAGELVHLEIEAPAITEGVGVGDSVAINGACLTVTALAGGRFSFDAVRETLERTSLGGLAPGGRVNLERAMRAGDRLDGHIVQGHVDEAGRVRSLQRRGDDVRLAVECSEAFSVLLVEKGSVTVDGVSLTVVRVEPRAFDVALIPHTLEVTTLGGLRPGDPVNLEADVLGKYVKRYLDRIVPGLTAARGERSGS